MYKTVALACDHAGFSLKNELMLHLSSRGIEFRDFGTYNEESCDYPDFAAAACRAVLGRMRLRDPRLRNRCRNVDRGEQVRRDPRGVLLGYVQRTLHPFAQRRERPLHGRACRRIGTCGRYGRPVPRYGVREQRKSSAPCGSPCRDRKDSQINRYIKHPELQSLGCFFVFAAGICRRSARNPPKVCPPPSL